MTKAERKARSEAVMARRDARRERRRQATEDFRRELIAELGGGPLPASKRALVDACVSANGQIADLSYAFDRGYLSQRRAVQLQIARSELRRCLRCLGLVGTDGDADEDEKPETIEQILADAGVMHGRA